MIARAPLLALATDHAYGHETENIMSSRRERPVAIRLLGVTGKVPVTCERMVAIRNPETMAGSPDADRRSASRRLAHGFCFLDRPSFENR
jgi:hypothetical protein